MPDEKDQLAEKLKQAQEAADKQDSPDTSEQLEEELQKMTELAKRTMADLENYRRRQEEERSTWFNMANAELLKQILPIIDNFDRAKSHIPEGAKDWAQGVTMCIDQLHKVMDNSGVMKIETVGKTFNPDHHEALIQGPGEKDIVIEELEKGYMLGNRVIRHAKVSVGNGEK